ncbi:MAG: cupin domain-containing protein [Burkholderiaceae bacterium]|nr:cupin domain-containing protein [Burkholderiaceae bacterium]
MFAPLRIRVPAAIACAMLVVALSPVAAQTAGPGLAPIVPQTPGFTSKPVLVAPITGVEGKELVLISVTLAPGASSPAHTHPGDCYGTVLEGTMELRVAGQEPRRLTAGESYSTLANPVHQFTNVGDTPVRLLNALVVEKGKPRTVPQSEPVK